MRTPAGELLGIDKPVVQAPMAAMSLWAGQDVDLVRQAQPAADIVAELTARL